MLARPLLVVAVCAALGSSSCAAPSTDDAVVARAGEATLTETDLRTLMTDAGVSVSDGSTLIDANTARAVIDDWVRSQLIERSGVVERYSSSPADTGVACLDVAFAVDVPDAESIIGRLADGEEWDAVVGPMEAQIGYESEFPCTPLEQFGPLAERLGSIVPGAGPEIVDPGDGTVAVVQARAADALDMADFLAAIAVVDPSAVAAIAEGALSADIYVAPRFGEFDAESLSVVPLG